MLVPLPKRVKLTLLLKQVPGDLGLLPGSGRSPGEGVTQDRCGVTQDRFTSLNPSVLGLFILAVSLLPARQQRLFFSLSSVNVV